MTHEPSIHPQPSAGSALPGRGTAHATAPVAVAAKAPCARSSMYIRLLGMAFALFFTLRVVSYLPTLLAIHASGDSNQHSLWTWGTWLGSNFTMAAWLYEESGRRLNRVVGLNLCNAAMCAATVGLIVFYRVVAP